MKQFWAMVYARTMEFVRDRGTFFWNLLFPVILVLGFSFAFSGDGDPLFKVGILGSPPPVDGHPESFLAVEQAEFIPYTADSPDEPLGKLRRHELDLVLDFNSRSFYLNAQGRNASLLRRLLRSDPLLSGFPELTVRGAPIRYVDWLVPGVIGMNIMFSCLFGVGFVIVRYRKNGVLKRLKATPVSALGFVSAQALSRFLIVILTSAVVFAGTNAVLRFRMEGSWILLLGIAALGIVSMEALGLVFAARFRSEELVSGLMNLVTLPMLALSGVFFSLEGSPAVLRTVSGALPLTHVIQAARGVMLEGAGLVQTAPHLLFLAAFSAAALAAAAALFKWE
jgi:ABC-type multidrug transport system permease subunit